VIPEAVARLRQRLGIPVDPGRRGPVRLDRFFEEMTHPRVSHFALPDLTRGAVAAHLGGEGIEGADLGDPAERLDGFVFFAGAAAWAYVSVGRDNPLVRRRFSAAHELGHVVLHRDSIGRFRADKAVLEAGEADDQMEREANRFAAELLMPADVCAARADELTAEYGACPRGVLEYRLAAELLVSGEAIRYRLNGLGVGND